MKHIITQRDKDEIVELYNKGYNQIIISVNTNYPLSTVKAIIKEMTGYTQDRKPVYSKYEKSSLEKKNEKVIELYRSGKTINEICELELLGRMSVESILVGAGLIKSEEMKKCSAIDISDVNKFANRSCNIGDSYIITINGDETSCSFLNTKKIVLVKVLKKYTHTVLTDKGCFQYIDLYMGTKVNSEK